MYKDQGLNWHPQSDSLGVSSLKQTHSTPPLNSGLHHLVESLGQIDFALLVVSIESDYETRLTLFTQTTCIHTQVSALHLFSKVVTRGTHTKSALSAHLLSQVSPIGIASSDQVQRQQQRDEPVRKNTHLVLDTLASRLRSYHSIVGVESLVFWVIRTQLIYIQSIVCMSGWNYQ